MKEPQEIEEREHEQSVLRVAAVDVAKAPGVVCTRVPRESGRGFVTKVWPVDATTNAILELADHLAGLRVEKVVLESTSDYWRPFFYLLEAAGLEVALVNARDVKNAPGRPKTDAFPALDEAAALSFQAHNDAPSPWLGVPDAMFVQRQRAMIAAQLGSSEALGLLSTLNRQTPDLFSATASRC